VHNCFWVHTVTRVVRWLWTFPHTATWVVRWLLTKILTDRRVVVFQLYPLRAQPAVLYCNHDNGGDFLLAVPVLVRFWHGAGRAGRSGFGRACDDGMLIGIV